MIGNALPSFIKTRAGFWFGLHPYFKRRSVSIDFCSFLRLSRFTQLVLLLLFPAQNHNHNNDDNQQQNQKQENEPTKDKKKSIESEDDLLDLGFKRFKLGDAEDYFVFKASGNTEYEVEIWAVSKRGRLRSYGTILVEGKKGYKGNPLDDDLDQYKSCYLKILNDEDAIIKNLGEKHNDQYFEIY